MKVIVTKYAVTSGPFVMEATYDGGLSNMISEILTSGGQHMQHFHFDEWHQTKESAIAKVNEMFEKKRQSLQKQVAGLEKKRLKALAVIAHEFNQS